MTDRPKKTEAELLALLDDCPTMGSVWEHYKGGTYVVFSPVILESAQEPLVTYMLLGGAVAFARPPSEWSEVVEHEGKSVPRFRPKGVTP